MDANELRALADALERIVPHIEDILHSAPDDLERTAAYLRQRADKEVAATVYVAASGEKPMITGWDTTAFAAGEEVALYAHPAPASPQADAQPVANLYYATSPHGGRRLAIADPLSPQMGQFAVYTHPAPASPQAEQKRDWSTIDAAIREYLDNYELIGEDDSGADACYTPTERELYLIYDAINGLLADESFVAAISAPQADEVDLDAVAMQQMRQAAAESTWMPSEYTSNDWIADVCRWLRDGPPAAAPQAEPIDPHMIVAEDRFPDEQAEPKVAASFYTEDAELIGTTDAPIKKIMVEDDGSIHVFIDHWPQAEPQNIRERWNIECQSDGSLLVCFNLHEKGEKCEYEHFVPARAQAEPKREPGWHG